MQLPDPYRPEAQVCATALARLTSALDWPSAVAKARPWIQAARDQPVPFWALESLLKEYPISSAEGLSLMRLAEALLRVPDAQTAIELTADQLGRADFTTASSVGEAQRSALARLTDNAITLAKRFLPTVDVPRSDYQSVGLLGNWGAKAVVAATLRAVQLLGHQFVLGQDIHDAMRAAQRARGGRTAGADSESMEHVALRYSFDMLGEGARSAADAKRYWQRYQAAIAAIAQRTDPSRACADNDGVSIKLSALHPRYEAAQRVGVMHELLPSVWQLCEQAARANINLTLDAEEADRLELSLELFDALVASVARHAPQWSGFGLAIQSYQTRALDVVEQVAGTARRHGVHLMCRLVKGAYWDTEIKRAQELGLDGYPVFTHKHHTDIAYLACAKAMLNHNDVIYAQFATHNAVTIAAIAQMGGGARYELQRLHGMGEGVYREVMQSAAPPPCRVYAPVGSHRDLLAYLVRRLLENGANSSFVHQLADPRVPMDELLASPLHLAPQPGLVLPSAIFAASGGRRNSRGLDLSLASARAPLGLASAQCKVPTVPVSGQGDIEAALAKATAAWPHWRDTPVAARAEALLRCADALEAQMPRFCALLVAESFKTWGDAVSEVREAVDFLRYYAQQAQVLMQPLALPQVDGRDGAHAAAGITGETNALHLQGRGVWVCISPWNFPLAIFMGQVAAALVTGNAVLAKPAEQTPGVALEAVRLLHAAGVHSDALVLLNGAGETVGAGLVACPGIAGVVFTGSTQVAKTIQRALAAKEGEIVPLIAETGGINAMVVDSSALAEQVCDAVVQSAFRSAGQRCSALRLLCIHADIAEAVIAMVCGAAAELRVGDPADFATDVGPLIDAQALANVTRQVRDLQASTRQIFPPQGGHAAGTGQPADVVNLLRPHIFEVARISDLREEIFGPVLQVLRWSGDPLAVIAQINALGFGLTLGIQTRIDSRALAMARAARVGNVYINRNQIGAVVGVQPFGGQGLSGTGPKAGGPHYLARFCTEQTITINTTAAGGNAALLAGSA